MLRAVEGERAVNEVAEVVGAPPLISGSGGAGVALTISFSRAGSGRCRTRSASARLLISLYQLIRKPRGSERRGEVENEGNEEGIKNLPPPRAYVGGRANRVCHAIMGRCTLSHTQRRVCQYRGVHTHKHTHSHTQTCTHAYTHK